MPFIDKSETLERFRKNGRNSSHFIWLLADLKFFECQNGWVFAFTQVGEVTLFALEPLIPGAPTEYGPEHVTAFQVAWQELKSAVKPKISAFVAVYKPFCALLEAQRFQWIKVGEEPWVDLADCIPQGNAGKGVRSARNQALNSGLEVVEWLATEIEADPARRQLMETIYQEWSSARAVALTGFMNSTDPFAHMGDRRYFVLRSPERIEAYLVATPVPGIKSYFLEDLVIRARAPRGSGELLTLESMVALQKEGALEASLGVVSMNSMDSNSAAQHLPKAVRFFMQTVPTYFAGIYNFQGMEVYRKRFKPHVWQGIHLCVRNDRLDLQDSRAWLKVLFALLISFKPRLQITPKWIFYAIFRPILRYPITSGLVLLNFLSFAFINHFGNLPEGVLEKWGFSGNSPYSEWIRRSIVSDFLYFNAEHFLFWGLGYCAVAHWAERKHKLRFLLPYMIAVCVFDDIINHLVLILPFEYFQPNVFHELISAKDVGGSLGLATLVGLQLHQFRKLREPLFAIAMLGLTLAFAFSSAKLQLLVMNLNHVLFLVVGYLTGKVLFEYSRYNNSKASKGKPPIGKSVRLIQVKNPRVNDSKKSA